MSELAALRAEVRELQTALYSGGGERALSLKETAVQIGYSTDTLRRWRRHSLYRVEVLLVKEGGHLHSTPHRIDRWRAAIAADLARILND